jgi:release factor glutamine methyltransferase
VGTGSGAIAAALAVHLPGALVEASDISPEALRLARSNLEALGLAGRVNLVAGDLMEAPFQSPFFDIICANLPYIPTGDIPSLPPEIRCYEPLTALDGGPEGLDLYIRLLPQAARRLKPKGAVLCECQPGQFPELSRMAIASGLEPRPPVPDFSGRDRVFSATRP